MADKEICVGASFRCRNPRGFKLFLPGQKIFIFPIPPPLQRPTAEGTPQLEKNKALSSP